MLTIYREYDFEAAHYLPCVPEGHKCGKMHGHSYLVQVGVSGPVCPQAGWVTDFACIDAVLKPLIAKLDHSTLNDIIDNPTSEALVLWLVSECAALGLNPSSMRVSETRKSFALWVAP